MFALHWGTYKAYLLEAGQMEVELESRKGLDIFTPYLLFKCFTTNMYFFYDHHHRNNPKILYSFLACSISLTSNHTQRS